jgi:RNA polymerase subunit RPABC4/transcription elongation factor Spt4
MCDIMYCKKCGKKIPDDSKFCPCCGSAIENSTTKALSTTTSSIAHVDSSKSSTHRISCPWCGSEELQAISKVTSEGFGLERCLLCGLCGICGLLGLGETTTEHYWVCRNCGKKFKI